MHAGDTITAIATAPGLAPRAVIRLSGPGTTEALRVLLDVVPEARGPHHAVLRLGERTIPVLVLRFVGGASYTGQDSAEIITVSNPTLVQRILDRITALDSVRLAGPGEFTAQAFLNGKLTLAQSEGVAATIAAENQAQLDAAEALLSGRTGKTYHAWSDELATLLALVEAGVDFTDQEDVVPIDPSELAARLVELHAHLLKHLGPPVSQEAPSHRPRVVLAGLPNAGKSTLFNALLGRARAIVSQTAGTTRDVLEEPLDLSSVRPGAGQVTLTDLAGLDEALADNPIDVGAQALAREAIERADLVIQCDPTGRFEALPGVKPGAPVLRVRTKADQPAPCALAAPIEVCALDGYHMPVLRRAIADSASGAGASSRASVVPRHRLAITEACEHLLASIEPIDPDERVLHEPELVAGEMRLALNAIGELAGDITTDDVIGRVFATFCVGK